MIKIGNKKVARIYLGKSSIPPYFVGQMIPSMQKIDDPRFLLCDGSAHVWTDAQKAVLPTGITNNNVAPNMSGRTTLGNSLLIGYTATNGLVSHGHYVTNTSSTYWQNATSVGTSSCYSDPYFTTVKRTWKIGASTVTAESNYAGSAEGTSSKRTYVYWYLYIGED